LHEEFKYLVKIKLALQKLYIKHNCLGCVKKNRWYEQAYDWWYRGSRWDELS